MSKQADSASKQADSVSEQVDSVSEQVDGVSGQADSASEQVDGVSEQADGVSGQVEPVSEWVEQRNGVPVLVCAVGGPPVAAVQDALDLIGAAFSRADVVALPAARLDQRFFTLSTGLAGEIMQKFVNYRIRLAVVGDIAAHLAASSALRALVSESNQGRHIWFVADLGELDTHLP